MSRDSSNDDHDLTLVDATRVVGQDTRVQTVVSNVGDGGAYADSELDLPGPGACINHRFELLEKLGEGGMSIVYRALDRRKAEAQDANPYIAIKLLNRAFARHPQAFVSLQREAVKSQTLAHPNIITVYDFDRDGDIIYMTMEQLRGQTLKQVIAQHPCGLDQAEACAIITRLCAGLAYAHSKDIIHADLKPGNVFVTDRGEVKILDFGIARANSQANLHREPSAPEHSDDLVGLTPPYASLEMLQGMAPLPADDIYSLGLISFELLCGHHPFKKLPASEALRRKLKPPSITGLNHRQGRALNAALAFAREERLASVEAFETAFQPKSWSRQILAAAAICGIAGLVWLGGQQYFARQPATPFDELPLATQQQVTSALAAAREASDFNDINGALIYYDRAYQLHPKNPQASRGLERIVSEVLHKSADGLNNQQSELARLDILLAYPSLAENPALLRRRQQLLQAVNDKLPNNEH